MGNKPHHEISKEFGVGRSTIGKWLRQYKRDGNIDLKSKEKRPQDWSAEQIILALIEAGSMISEEFAAWCRKHGIFPHHLEQWRKEAISGMSNPATKKQAEKEKQYKKEISPLKRDLTRKEKALAETWSHKCGIACIGFLWGVLFKFFLHNRSKSKCFMILIA